MQRTKWLSKDEVIESLVLKTDRGDREIESIVNMIGFEAEYAANWGSQFDARGEHELARALVDGGTL